MVRMDSVRGGLPVWAVGSRPLLLILVILVGMCGNGSGMYMEGDMVTGDNWIFMARYSTLTFFSSPSTIFWRNDLCTFKCTP